jgi:phage minor structural protein
MIRLFHSTDRDFATNGDAILKPLLARVREQDNSDFYLDLELPLDHIDLVTQDAIVVAPTPFGDQPFRINNPIRSGRRIKTRAWHVSYDSRRLLIADSYVVDKDCAGALQHLNNATDTVSPFRVDSDVTVVNSFRCVRKSLWEALQTVLERWGGHLVRDGFNIQIVSSRAVDNGAVIRYGKNLIELTSTETWDATVTKLLPVGQDGLLLNAADGSNSIYVVADVSYDQPYTRSVSFDQSHISQDDYPTEQAYTAALVRDLGDQAEAYVAAHKVPEINYTLAAHLDYVTGIGDVIKVVDSRLGIELLTEVTAYEYDAISKRFVSLEFGNHKRTLSGLIPDIAKKAKEV